MKQVCRRIAGKYRKQNLATKIVILFSLILLIPSLIFAGSWMKREAEQIYEETQAQSLFYVERTAKDIASNRSLIENTVLAALSQKDFLFFCNEDMNADGLRLVKFSQNELKNMKYIFQSNTLIESASFYFFNEDLYEIWDIIYSYDRFQNEAFAGRLHEERGSIFLLDGITEKGKGYACCYREVYLDTTLIGVLEIRMPAEDFLNQDTESPEQEGYNLLINAAGDVILSQSDENHLSSDVVMHICSEFVNGITKNSFSVKTEEGYYYGAYYYLEELDSYLIHCVSRQSLLDGIYRSALVAVAFVCIILIILYWTASSVYRKMLSRLEILMDSMRQVQEGHLDVRVEGCEDGDELDELGNYFNRMLSRMEGLIAENVERQTAAVNAELNALQSQIDRHFLYNALESIRMMAEVKQEREIADTIVSLGSLLRYNMSWKSKTVTLQEEITIIERYVYLVNMIYDFDVQLQIRLDVSLMNTVIPKLCLQPLVENCVVHGMVPGCRPLHITISAVENGKVLVMQILDDGKGIKEERLYQLNAVLEGSSHENVRTGKSGIGIANVHKRLQMNFGIEYGIVLQSEEDAYTLAKIVIPYEKKNQEADNHVSDFSSR